MLRTFVFLTAWFMMLPAVASAQRPDLLDVLGTLVSCNIEPDLITVRVQARDGVVSISTTSQNTTPRRPPDYVTRIPEVHTREGACPRLGSRVRLSICKNCQPDRLDALEVIPADATNPLDFSAYRLWLVRHYVDTTEPGGDIDEFIASMVIARHNRWADSWQTFWMRGLMSRNLFAYSSLARARVMFERYGRGNTNVFAFLDAGAAIYPRHGAEIGLVRAAPFVPDPVLSPFVGHWGVFVVEAYTEDASGKLSPASTETRK